MLLVALASTVIVLVTFVFTTLVDEPATAVLLAIILVLSVGLDLGWKRGPRRPCPGELGTCDRRVNRLRPPAPTVAVIDDGDP